MRTKTSILFLLTFLPLSCWAAEDTNAPPGLFGAVTQYELGDGSGMAKGIASDGTNYLVALQSATNNSIIAQFLAPNGSPTGAPINIGGSGSLPLVSFDGANYLVIWVDPGDPPSDIYGQFISRQGTNLGVPFIIGADVDAVEVGGISFDGNNYLVVWEANARSTNLVSSIQGRFVTPSGTLQGDPVQISSDPESQKLPSPAFDGTNYVVSWMAQVSGTNLWNVKARFISKEGVLLEPFTISQTPALTPNPIATTFGGTNYLAVWGRELGPYICTDVCNGFFPSTNYWLMLHGRLLSRDGAFAGPEFQITHARGGQSEPAAAFDGHNFLVTWHDKRYSGPGCPGYFWGLYGQQIGQNGEMDEPEFFNPPYRSDGVGPVDGSSALIFASGQYLALWRSPFAVPPHYWQKTVIATVISQKTTSRPALRNFVRLADSRFQVDMVGGDPRTYLIDVSTNFVDWMAVSATFSNARLIFPDRYWSGADPFPGANRIFYRANDGTVTCTKNLRRIKSAKDRWALDNCAFDGFPGPNDLWGPGKYLPSEPICPNGGPYFLERVGTRPWCALGATAGHTL